MDLKPPNLSSDTFQRLQKETSTDIAMSALYKVVKQGWPSDKALLPPEIRPYWSFRDEISIHEGVLLKSDQVIIPSSLRQEMLTKIHKAHQGADSSIRRARETLFWPAMSAAIRHACSTCGLYAQYKAERPTEPMQSQEIPQLPWERISVDLFQLDGKQYLVSVDHYSDFIDIDLLRNTSATAVINAMKKNFARLEIPQVCVSDNGPQFISHEYSRFASEYGFKSIKSSPYHSRSNGKAESAVKVAKNILKKARHEDPYLALLAYRNTPQQGHTYSPAERIMSRKLRDITVSIPQQLKPYPVSSTGVVNEIISRRNKSKEQYDKRASSQPLDTFSRNDQVYVKPNPKNKHKPWIFGEVVENRGQRSCVVNTSLGLIRRNHKQIRKAEVRPQELYKPKQGLDMLSLQEETVPPPTTVEPVSISSTAPAPMSSPISAPISPAPMSSPSSPVPTELALAPPSFTEGTHVPLRRSTRVRRPPTRWGDYIQ